MSTNADTNNDSRTDADSHADDLIQDVREAITHADAHDKPHRSERVLKLLLQEKGLSYRDAADTLSDAVEEYSVSHEAVRRAKKDLGIPTGTSVFDDLGDDDTEPGQPSSFFFGRSDDAPIHPLNTDCYERANPPEGTHAECDAEPLITIHSPPPIDSESPTAPPETPVSRSDGVTGVYKPHPDLTTNHWRVDRTDREASLVAPPWAAEQLQPIYRACGCGSCPERHYLDGDGGVVECANPIPVTVAGARRIYRMAEGRNVADDRDGNDVSRGRNQYRQLTHADTAALNYVDTDTDPLTFARGRFDYSDITTVLVSLRQSATDAEDRIVTPWTLLHDCLDGWGEARDGLPKDAAERLLGYYWTIAGTDHWATPHLHCYFWYYDPDDTVTTDLFRPVVRRYHETAAFPAAKEAHFVDDDPTKEMVDGPVKVAHDPLLMDPDAFRTRHGDGPFADLGTPTEPPKRIAEGDGAQSRGAIYVSSQLPRLALYNSEPDPHIEAAAYRDMLTSKRNTAHGGGDFYRLAKITEHFSGYDGEATPT